MDYLIELFRHLPAHAIAGGVVPVIQFTASKLGARQSVHKKHQLRERTIALNAFVASMNAVSGAGDAEAACLQDALRDCCSSQWRPQLFGLSFTLTTCRSVFCSRR